MKKTIILVGDYCIRMDEKKHPVYLFQEFIKGKVGRLFRYDVRKDKFEFTFLKEEIKKLPFPNNSTKGMTMFEFRKRDGIYEEMNFDKQKESFSQKQKSLINSIIEKQCRTFKNALLESFYWIFEKENEYWKKINKAMGFHKKDKGAKNEKRVFC